MKDATHAARNVTDLDAARRDRAQRTSESALFAEPVPADTVRAVQVATTGTDHPLTLRAVLDVSRPADQVMYALWAGFGLDPTPSSLMTVEHDHQDSQFFGVASSWANSANRDAVTDLSDVQFAQLFQPDTETYAELDPAHGWRGRVTIEKPSPNDDFAAGDPGSPVRITLEPFGIPLSCSAAQIDVLLKASDGEPLTPLEQQVLVHINDDVEIPFEQMGQAAAMAAWETAAQDLSPHAVHLLPVLMAELPLSMAACELFSFVADNTVFATTKAKMPLKEFRRFLADSQVIAARSGLDGSTDLSSVYPEQAPEVIQAWGALQDLGLITVADKKAKVSDDAAWLTEVSGEWQRTHIEVAIARWLLAQGQLEDYGSDGAPVDAVHPTIEFETAQDYADSLISDASSSPEEMVHQMLLEELRTPLEASTGDDEVEHVLFTIELEGMPEPVTRRMSLPLSANLHGAMESVLIMFGWELTHLWQIEVMNEHRFQAVAASSEEIADDDEVPVAAELHVGDVLQPGGPQAMLIYDYGDGWQMVLTPGEARTAGPDAELLNVEGSCPPEDAGGPAGYEQKLLAIAAPDRFEQENPDFESEEIRSIANWARAHRLGKILPTPGLYEIDEDPFPHAF